jgi:hypothetical protein
MRIVAGLTGFLASVCMATTAPAALVTYTFSGLGSGELGGTAFADKAFDIVLIGDTDLVVDPFATGQVFEISPLQSARVAIDGFGDSVVISSTRLGLNRSANVFFLGPIFGPDYLDLSVSDAQETAFTFAAPYGPVGGAANTFGQFTGVATTQGALSFSSVSEVSFAATTGPAAPIPEPVAWTLMIVGFGAAGAAMRRRRPVLG